MACSFTDTLEPKRRACGAPARLQRGDVGVVERGDALEYDCAHAFLQMVDLAGAAEFRADPLPVSISRDGTMTVC